jgi:hypothetical protein
MKPRPPGIGPHGECHIVATPDRAYVVNMRIAPQGAQSPGDLAVPGYRLSRPLALAVVVIAAVLAGTIALWVHYGTAVFYEMILAGIAACL